MKPLHILFCLDYYAPHIGGSEVLFTYLAEGLATLGWKVSVVTQALPGIPLTERRNGVDIYRIRTFEKGILFSLGAIPKMLTLSRQADIIHTSPYYAVFPAWLATKLRKKPGILTTHELWIGKWKLVSDDSRWANFLKEYLERLIYLLSFSQYVAVSDATRKDMLAAGLSPVQRIYNGIQPWKESSSTVSREKFGFSRTDFLFLFVGRPGCSKGLTYLVAALQEVRKEHPNAKLLAVVSQPKNSQKDFRKIVKQISRLELTMAIQIVSHLENERMPQVYAMADAVVVPSLSEGFGFVAAEACAMGKSIIASRVASLPEVIGGNVLWSQPRNVESLAIAMKKAILGQWEQAPEKSFPVSQMIEEYRKLYQQLNEADKETTEAHELKA